MVKGTPSDKEEDHKFTSHDNLKRRPIYREANHLDENPGKPKKIYPVLPDQNELSSSEEEENVEDVVNCRVETENKKTQANTQNDKYFKYFLLFFLLLIVYLSFIYFSSFHKSVTEVTLKEKLNNMQNIFQDQNHLTFRILEKALTKIVNATKEPSAPAIITVVVNKDARYKSHEFSRYLASMLAPHSTVLINESVSHKNNPDEIKFKIDNEIQSIAKEKNLFVVIVDNLQNIPLKSAMVFHNFCDHEAAPFKEAVFLFIVPLDEILPKGTTNKLIDKAAFQQLKNIWPKATPDEIDSLITRITVNVINIS